MISQNVLNKIKDSNIEIKIAYLEMILEPIVEAILDKKRKMEAEAKPLMTIGDIAERFKVSKTTIQNWVRRGTITGNKVGKNRYFTFDEVNTALGDYGWKKEIRR